MTFNRLLSTSFVATLSIAGCTTPVDLGGPRTDASAPSSSTNEDAGPLQGLSTAQSYANGEVPCTIDADCGEIGIDDGVCDTTIATGVCSLPCAIKSDCISILSVCSSDGICR